MTPRANMIVGLLVASAAAVGTAQDKPGLPAEAPPRIASIVALNGEVIVYRDFQYMLFTPKRAGPVKPNELVPANPSPGTMFACAVEFPLKDGRVYDAEGKKLDIEAVKKRIAVGDTVLVTTSGKMVDPAYLKVVKKDTLILVQPPPPPGPPLPFLPPKVGK
jgi:hypothetical protein